MRFGIGMNTDHTLEEVGQQFSVTRERIRQIEAKALRKLKHPSSAAASDRRSPGPTRPQADPASGRYSLRLKRRQGVRPAPAPALPAARPWCGPGSSP